MENNLEDAMLKGIHHMWFNQESCISHLRDSSIYENILQQSLNMKYSIWILIILSAALE